jgi:hypothetical protein
MITQSRQGAKCSKEILSDSHWDFKGTRPWTLAILGKVGVTKRPLASRRSQYTVGMCETRGDVSRRRFGRAALLGAALPAVSAAPQQQAGAGLSDAENAEVEARYDNAMRQYGSRLSEEQRQRIRRVLNANERMMSNIREFPLDNGDTPATVLKLEGGK